MLPDTDDPSIYLLYAGWSHDKEDGESTAFISIRKSMTLQMNWYSILIELVGILNPKYAIGHERDTAFDGMLFPSGMANGSDTCPNEAMRRRKYSWQMGQSENVFLHGMIRDVFEWNCLNEMQLSQSIGELTLKEWIQKDATRGKLTPINDDLTLWEVDMKYESVIFETLLDADVIFDKDRHMYWFDEGKKLTPAERIALKRIRRKEEFDRLVDEWGPEKTEKWLNDRGW
ncbi:hypothetical protein K2Y11_08685 [bacterium]|nr:hypothetical protein [bacterium]